MAKLRFLKGLLSRKTLVNLAVLFAALVIGAAACELTLRLFYPKYAHAAGGYYDYNLQRVWGNHPNSRNQERHPDTGSSHFLHFNNFGLRQHRDFSRADLEQAINVGIFGDSFVENVFMAAQYSLTEPLDYLLNLGPERFNVLNFGVSGYGTGQSFVHYDNFRYVEDLDYVLYVYSSNDLRNIYETSLFSLDDEGNLLRNKPVRSRWWIRLVSRLHTSYLLLDVAGKAPTFNLELALALFFADEKEVDEFNEGYSERKNDVTAEAIEREFIQYDGRLNDENLAESIAVFQQLIRLWKRSVEENGARFYIVTLPRRESLTVNAIIDDDFHVINLYDCFAGHNPGFTGREWIGQPYRFRKNGHWNEAGNQLAAVCLYRLLESEIGLPEMSQERLREEFYKYYSAFDEWTSDEVWVKKTPVSEQELAAIRTKYRSFEREAAP